MYFYRVSATNPHGTTHSATGTFTTKVETDGTAPAVSDPGAGELTAQTAKITVSINPHGRSTSFIVEYGTTDALSKSTSAVDVGDGSELVAASTTLTGLLYGTEYHFRVTATNSGGTTSTSVYRFNTGSATVSAVADVAYTVPGRAVTIPVLANDVSNINDPLLLVSVTNPAFGSVRRNENGTITYTPSAKFTVRDAFRYVVSDQRGNATSTIVDIANTHVSAAGRYASLLGETDGDFSHTGALGVYIGATGVLTGQLSFAGVDYSFRSTLQHDGSSVAIIRRPGESPAVITLHVALAERTMSGNVTLGAVTEAFTSKAALHQREYNTPLTGRYTLLLPYEDDALPKVHGIGAATMNVSELGVVRVAGRTAAGAPFSAVSQVRGDNRFALYSVVTTPRRTSLHGWLEFRQRPGVGDLDGQLGWSAQASGSAVVSSTVIGSAYVPPVSGSLALPFLPGIPTRASISGTARSISRPPRPASR